MDLLLLLARLALAGVFAVAGAAKLADRRGSIESMRNFGVPVPLVKPLGIGVPAAELAVAIALIPTATARWGALGALILLLAFMIGIGTNLARGNHPDCHCFGQLHSSPAGWPTLVRNGLLAALAAVILWRGWDDSGTSTVAWLGDVSAVEGIALGTGVTALALLAAVGWTLIQLVGQNGRLLLRLDALEQAVASGAPITPPAPAKARGAGLPIGSVAPGFSLPGLHGETMTLDALRATGKPLLLVFTDPNCGPCNALLPDLGRWQHDHADVLTVTTLSRGTAEANRAKTLEHGLAHVLLQKDREVATAYQAQATPAAVLVRVDGTIGSTVATGGDAIRQLVALVVGPKPSGMASNGHAGPANGTGAHNGSAPVPRAEASTSRIGQPTPPLHLPDLDGNDVDLGSLAGTPTVLLFWNPGCGYCQRMLDDLKRLESELAPESPRILVLSKGDPEHNRAMGLRSRILLDNDFAVGRAYGATGTPSAVLIDAEGKIASPVVVGAPAVLSLASSVPA